MVTHRTSFINAHENASPSSRWEREGAASFADVFSGAWTNVLVFIEAAVPVRRDPCVCVCVCVCEKEREREKMQEC